MTPKVSIIVPVYNVEKYLSQCLDSIIGQTLPEIEAICINDCSSDNSLSILQKYASQDQRFKVINLPENHGVGYVRNIALEHVTADYLMYLDPDDWLEPNACEQAYNQIKTYGNDFAFFNYSTYYEAKGKKYCNHNKFQLLLAEKDTNHINLNKLLKPFEVSSESWFKIYKTDFIKNNHIEFSEHYAFGDRLFYYRAFIASNNVSVINKSLVNYRKRKGSITTNSKHWQDSIDAWQIIKGHLSKDVSLSAQRSFIVNSLNSQLSWFNSYTKAEKSIRNAFYEKLREQFLTYNLEEVKAVKEYIDYATFAKVIKFKDYTSFKYRKMLENMCRVENKNNKIIVHFLGIKFGVTKSGGRLV